MDILFPDIGEIVGRLPERRDWKFLRKELKKWELIEMNFGGILT